MSVSEIRILSGLGAGQRFPLSAQGRVVGRAPTADIRVRDEAVSDHHAMVVSKDGQDFVYDLGSDTGTFINDVRVEQAELQPGDVIRVGQVRLEYFNAHAPRPVQAHAQYSPSSSPVPQHPSAGALVPTNANNPMAMHAQLLLSQMALMQQQAQMGLGMPMAGMSGVEEPPPGPSILDHLKAIYEFYRPYLVFIALFGLLGFAAGASTLVLSPPGRSATFEVNLISVMADNPVRKFERGMVEFFRAAHVSFKSPALIEKTLASLGDYDITPGRIGAIQGGLSLEGVGKAGSTVTYRGTFGGGAGDWPLRFLGAHVRLFLDSEIEKTLKQIRVEVDFLEKQLAENEKELSRTEREVLEFKTRNMDGLPDQAARYYDLLFELERQKSSTESEYTKIKSLQRLDRVRLSSENPLTESRVSSARPYQSAIVDTNAKLATARASGKGDDHPEVMQLRSQLEELQRLARDTEASGGAADVVRQRNPTYNAIQDNLRGLDAAEETARSEMGRLRRELERVKGVVDRLPQLDAQYASLQRSYDTSRDLHKSIFAQLKATRLQYDLEKASARARYDIITPPALEFISLFKVGGIRGAAGLIAGAIFALLIATIIRFRQLKRLPFARASDMAPRVSVAVASAPEPQRWPYR
jgi:hypothetical protein